MHKITVWETFFMLLTVIPVSKMLSSIFMKLIARIGTVDEEKWAGIGLAALGGIAGLFALGKVSAGALARHGGGVFGPGGGTPLQSGGGGTTLTNPTVPFPGTQGSATTASGASPGTVVNPPAPGTVPPITASIPQANSRASFMDELAGGVSQAGHTAALVGGALGSVAGAPVPGMSAATMAITGAAAKLVASPIAAAHKIGREFIAGTAEAKKQGMSLREAMGATAMRMANAQSVPEATTKLIASVLGSPLGGWGVRTSTKAVDLTFAGARWGVERLRQLGQQQQSSSSGIPPLIKP